MYTMDLKDLTFK